MMVITNFLKVCAIKIRNPLRFLPILSHWISFPLYI